MLRSQAFVLISLRYEKLTTHREGIGQWRRGGKLKRGVQLGVPGQSKTNES
jgi:hypothetical protein